MIQRVGDEVHVLLVGRASPLPVLGFSLAALTIFAMGLLGVIWGIPLAEEVTMFAALPYLGALLSIDRLKSALNTVVRANSSSITVGDRRISVKRLEDLKLQGSQVVLTVRRPIEHIHIPVHRMTVLDREKAVAVLRDAVDLDEEVASGLRIDEDLEGLRIALRRGPVGLSTVELLWVASLFLVPYLLVLAGVFSPLFGALAGAIGLVVTPFLLGFRSQSSVTKIEVTARRVQVDDQSFAPGRIDQIAVEDKEIVLHLLDPPEDVRIMAAGVTDSERWAAVRELRAATSSDDVALKREILKGSSQLMNRGKTTARSEENST